MWTWCGVWRGCRPRGVGVGWGDSPPEFRPECPGWGHSPPWHSDLQGACPPPVCPFQMGILVGWPLALGGHRVSLSLGLTVGQRDYSAVGATQPAPCRLPLEAEGLKRGCCGDPIIPRRAGHTYLEDCGEKFWAAVGTRWDRQW